MGTSGYDEIYAKLVPKLKGLDYAETAARLGFRPFGGSMRITFLARDYIIDESGVVPADGLPAHVNNKSVLAYYALSQGAGKPAYDYSPLFRLTGKVAGQWKEKDWMTERLGQKYQNQYGKFEEAARKLGMTSDGARGVGVYVWLYDLLPKIPVRLVFYDACDEFSCEVQIFFDNKALNFLEFECLAFLNGCFIHALLKQNES